MAAVKITTRMAMDLEVGDFVKLMANPRDLGLPEKYKYGVYKVVNLTNTSTDVLLEQIKPLDGERPISFTINYSYLTYIKESKADSTADSLIAEYKVFQAEQKRLFEALDKDLTKMIELLTAVHGDNFEFNTNQLKEQRSTQLTIRFPEVTIRNTNDRTRVLKELYVRFGIALHTNNNIYIAGTLTGTRGAVSVAELMSRYSHSHLPSSTRVGGFSQFCLGSTNIAINLGLLQDRNTPFSFDNFELLIHQISSYVGWESLEGGPHMRMHDIKSRQDLVEVTAEADIKEAYKQFIAKKIHFDPIYDTTAKSYKVKNSLQFETDLGTCTSHKANKVQGSYFSTAAPEDVQRLKSQHSSQFYNGLTFKGQPVNLTVYSDRPESETSTVVANPGITRGVLKLLEERLNSFILNNSDHIIEVIRVKEQTPEPQIA